MNEFLRFAGTWLLPRFASNWLLPRLAEPGVWDALHGRQGSAQTMAQGFYRGIRGMAPLDWQMNPQANMQMGEQAGVLAQQVFDLLYGPEANLQIMHGVNAGRAGQVFEELARRGLPTGISGGAIGVAQNLQQWSGAVNAVENIFASMGMRNVSTSVLMNTMDALTQGGLSTMRPGDIEAMVRRSHNLASASGMDIGQMGRLINQAGDMAQAAGLNRQFGVTSAQQSLAFGQAAGRMAGAQGFGGLSRDQMVAKDMELRTSAARSPIANMMGAFLSMQQAGLFGENEKLNKMANDLRAGNVEAFKGMTQSQFLSMLRDEGVSTAAAGQFLLSREANQRAIFEAGIGDKVRGMQGDDIEKQMSRYVQGAIGGVARSEGLNWQESGQLAQAMSAQLRQLAQDRPDIIGDPTKRNEELVRRLREQGGFEHMDPAQLRRIVGTGLHSMEAKAIRSGMGNLASLLTLHNQNILREGERQVGLADQIGAVQSQTAASSQGGFIQNVATALQQMAGGGGGIGDVIAQIMNGQPRGLITHVMNALGMGDPRVSGWNPGQQAPDGRGGTGQPGGITISGTLRITGDGHGIFENTRGVVAPY